MEVTGNYATFVMLLLHNIRNIRNIRKYSQHLQHLQHSLLRNIRHVMWVSAESHTNLLKPFSKGLVGCGNELTLDGLRDLLSHFLDRSHISYNCYEAQKMPDSFLVWIVLQLLWRFCRHVVVRICLLRPLRLRL